MVDDGAFGPEQVNVARQRREDESLLSAVLPIGAGLLVATKRV